MGLDNFWVHPDWEDESGDVTIEDIPKPDFEKGVYGGLFSGNGHGSFRGKVYNSIIDEVTPYSLYADELSNEQVHEIAEILEETEYEEVKDLSGYLDETRYNDFVLMFRFYADEGASLVSWW